MKFRRSNNKFIWTTFLNVVYFILGCITAVLVVNNADYELIPVVFIFLLPASLYFYAWYFTYITLSDSGIDYASPFKKYHLDWSEVNSYGGCITRGRRVAALNLADAHKITIGNKMLYVSKEEQGTQFLGLKLGIDYITFGYSPEMLDELKKYLPLTKIV